MRGKYKYRLLDPDLMLLFLPYCLILSQIHNQRSEHMSLAGNIETFYIATILQLLSNDNKTGVLCLKWENDEVNVYIKNGTIVYASEFREKYRLGNIIKISGKVSDNQLKNCLKISKENKLSLGKVLVKKGYITIKELQGFIHKQAENILYDLFFWEKGEFEYKDMDFELGGMVIMNIDIMSLILEATRRIDEMSVFKKLIPDENMIFKMSESGQNSEESRLTAREWRIYSMVDGERTVSRVVLKSGYDRYAVYKILNSLIASGHLKKSSLTGPEEQAEQACAQLAYMDSKNVREQLDTLGLPRSSLVRATLTKIVRDSVSAEELLLSVRQEAKKLAGNAEKDVLLNIKQEKQLSFMSKTLLLLCEEVDRIEN